jgi:hypothetical protein
MERDRQEISNLVCRAVDRVADLRSALTEFTAFVDRMIVGRTSFVCLSKDREFGIISEIGRRSCPANPTKDRGGHQRSSIEFN